MKKKVGLTLTTIAIDEAECQKKGTKKCGLRSPTSKKPWSRKLFLIGS
jgi:hypothetical protein